MQQIVCIITYMGKYPWYFPNYLHSCRYNPTIDFLIFTDNNESNILLMERNAEFGFFDVPLFNWAI